MDVNARDSFEIRGPRRSAKWIPEVSSVRRKICAKCFHTKDSHQVFLGTQQASGCQVWKVYRDREAGQCPCTEYESSEPWSDLMKDARREGST